MASSMAATLDRHTYTQSERERKKEMKEGSKKEALVVFAGSAIEWLVVVGKFAQSTHIAICCRSSQFASQNTATIARKGNCYS